MSNGCLTKEEIEEITKAFNKYDFNKTGKLNPKLFKKEMLSMGLNFKAPLIYEVINQFDTEEVEKKGGVTINEILNEINTKLGNTNSEDGMKHIFDLFKEKPEDKVLTLHSLKKFATSYGIKITDEEIKNMLERASESGEGLTYEEFCKVMKNDN